MGNTVRAERYTIRREEARVLPDNAAELTPPAHAKRLQQTGAYFSTVLLGLTAHALITLPVILWVFTKRNPFRFVQQMSQALLTAFSTASSTATLPVTMECAVTKASVSKRSTEFVLPLGPPSTWTGPRSTKRWPRSSSPRRSGST